jgi:hypothetical protein
MKKIVLFVFVFGFFACNENPIKPPKKLLDEETMENILYDIAILQAANINAPDILQANKIEAKDYIYKKYKIDSATYHQNNRYYAAEVNNYKHMHKRILARLEKHQNAKK